MPPSPMPTAPRCATTAPPARPPASKNCASTTRSSRPDPNPLPRPAPARYTGGPTAEGAMNLFQEHGVKDYAAAAAQIPVIDFAPYFAGEPGALARTAAETRRACEEIGFFYAAGHGVPEAVIERAFAASRRFHALPLETKLKLRLNENNIGYLPLDASVQGASTVHKATRPNRNESFFVSHDRGPDHPDVVAGVPLRGPQPVARGHARAARGHDGVFRG